MSKVLFTLRLSPENTNKEFPDSSTLLQFLQNEASTWSPVSELQGRFQGVWNELRNEFQQYSGEQQRVNLFNRIVSQRKDLFYSETAMGRTLLQLAGKLGGAAANGAYMQLSGQSHQHYLQQPNYALGVVAAAIAQGAGADERVGAELSAAAGVREELLQLRTGSAEALKNLETSSAALIDKQTETFNNLKRDLSDTFDKKLEQLSKVFTDSYVKWDGAIARHEGRVNELENSYEHKLRLDRPAKYWQKLEKTYRNWGRIWLFNGALFSVAFVYLLAFILYLPPDVLEGHNFADARGIRALIIFALIASVAVFLMRFLFKLSISSFHLSRDARERAQLTYFYLSLLKGGGVVSDHQQIILQSLFSRADTGLLKSEGLAMPGGTIDSIIGGMRGEHH